MADIMQQGASREDFQSKFGKIAWQESWVISTLSAGRQKLHVLILENMGRVILFLVLNISLPKTLNKVSRNKLGMQII